MRRIMGENFDHVIQSGVIDGGLSLVPQVADVVPFLTHDMLNPLIVNMSASHEAAEEALRDVGESQKTAMDSALERGRKERTFPAKPNYESSQHIQRQEQQMQRITRVS